MTLPTRAAHGAAPPLLGSGVWISDTSRFHTIWWGSDYLGDYRMATRRRFCPECCRIRGCAARIVMDRGGAGPHNTGRVSSWTGRSETARLDRPTMEQ